jgi:hypothetical protein
MTYELLTTTNLRRVATMDAAWYQEIKDQFEPRENGKFLAIDVDSGEAYLAGSSADAVVKARVSPS